MEHRGVCFGQRIVTFAFRSCCESDTYSTLNLVLNGLHDSGHPCLTKDLVFPFEFAESPCLVYHPYGKTVFINLSSLLTVTSMCSGTVVRPYIPGISPTENSCSQCSILAREENPQYQREKMVGDPRSLPHGVSR